jgi:hypothetical protein
LPLPLPQDDDSSEVVPASDFVISRTALRNNTSNYYINNRKSNFTEVTELLKGKGVDLDNNRFLILQVGGWAGLARAGTGWTGWACRQHVLKCMMQRQGQQLTPVSPFLLPMRRARLSRFR